MSETAEIEDDEGVVAAQVGEDMPRGYLCRGPIGTWWRHADFR
jgi:hypothetical protein